MTTFLGTLAHGATFALKDEAGDEHPLHIPDGVDTECTKLKTPLKIVDALIDDYYCAVYKSDNCTAPETWEEGVDIAYFGDNDDSEFEGAITK
ncbi:hypothetical protein DFQ26_005958 [Actinomortierella ambigua]|nr:hypothetical protein DFQ26_005958 [Actinomortierella ambigua]